jgi:Mandelate racemase / muconate lactonizing enzyme, N-terminal domain
VTRLTVVKITTDQDGLYGYGCATFTQRADLVKPAVELYLNPLLLGKTTDRIEDTWVPNITGVKLLNRGKLSQIAGCSINAFNEPGKSPLVEITEHGEQQLGRPLRIPPISVTLYEFGIA